MALTTMNMRWNSTEAYVADRDYQCSKAKGQLKYVEGFESERGKLLDFGAGVGQFVEVARVQGWEADGVERSTVAIKRAADQNGVKLTPSIPNKVYDVITLWDVADYLRSPIQTLLDLRDHLRPGGYIFVQVSNYESWVRLAHGEKWSLYLFDKQTYFSPYSLERLLSHCGFRNFQMLETEAFRPEIKVLIRNPMRQWKTWYEYFKARRTWPSHGCFQIITIAAQLGNGEVR